jgi:hypothetical protein
MAELFLLCRPRGGINDNLCQIEKCWNYAQRFGRTLVVDTSSSGGFGMSFRTFFTEIPSPSNPPLILSPSPIFLRQLETLDTRPACLAGRIRSYRVAFSEAHGNIVDRKTGERTTFDFDAAHADRLLVHDQCGGSEDSLNCLARLQFTSEFRRDVTGLLERLGPEPYSAVAIRNGGDYQTDYVRVLADLQPRVAGKRLLVCSDDPAVIDYAKRSLAGTSVLSISAPNTEGSHHSFEVTMLQSNFAQRYEHVTKAFAELLGLALARGLFVTKLVDGGILGGRSGFVVLAGNLFKNKQIVRQLLGLRAH